MQGHLWAHGPTLPGSLCITILPYSIAKQTVCDGSKGDFSSLFFLEKKNQSLGAFDNWRACLHCRLNIQSQPFSHFATQCWQIKELIIHSSLCSWFWARENFIKSSSGQAEEDKTNHIATLWVFCSREKKAYSGNWVPTHSLHVLSGLQSDFSHSRQDKFVDGTRVCAC